MQSNHSWIWQQKDWPDFNYDSDILLTQISTVSRLIGGLAAICQTLSDVERLDAQELVLTDDAMETAAIEGEILRRSSVRASIRKRLGLPVEREDRDARADGLVSVLLDARLKKPSLTEERLFGWHAALFPGGYSGLHKIRVAKYRGQEEMQIVSGSIGRETVHYVAPPKAELDRGMTRFFDWLNTENEPEPLIKAGIAHLWFIMIHPFDDGNGRIGRAVTDHLLARSYPSLMELVSFSKYISLDRKGYYRVLEAAGKNGMNITPWLKWFLQTFEAALQESQWIVERVVTKARFWQKNKNVLFNARQQKVINQLLDSGDRFEGGMTTRKYVGMTKCSSVTASRDLADLVEKNILQKRPGGGRSTSYELRRIGANRELV
ncbi:MAG TPA: Fic family protein [Desulfobacteraceae bacterium]|nr:Fic family protein [Desulfobacteraceae bacterium]